MVINLKTSRIWVVSLFYAFWLNSITFVFYLEKGVADVGLQLALIAGSTPVVVQMLLSKMEIREIMRPIMFTCVFVVIIILSFIANPTGQIMFIRLFNISFVLTVAMIIASCSDQRIIVIMASSYAVIGSAVLIMVNQNGLYIWGRLYTEGIHANFWGGIALSVGVTAFALRGRILPAACWIIVLVTLYNTSSRGSMVALFAGSIIVAAAWFVETRQKKFVLSLTVIILCLLGLVLVTGLFPQIFTSFLYHDLLLMDDQSRGLGTGLTGRVDAWHETLEIWMSRPIFGVGFRQHEAFVTSASSAHNAYLTMLADTGIFGLIAYILLISFSLWEAWRRPMPLRARFVLLAVILSYAVMGLFERRALNAGNPHSILFVICCYYSLRVGIGKFSLASGQWRSGGLKDVEKSRISG